MFKLTEKQQEIVDSNARIKLVMGGARSGKTTTLMVCIEKTMRELNSRNTKVLIHIPSYHMSRHFFRDVIHVLSPNIVVNVNKTRLVIETIYGTIETETFNKPEYGFSQIDKEINHDLLAIERKLLEYDIICSDVSSSSSLFATIINAPCNDIIAAGHCPEDKNNAFYKTWCSAYYSDVADIKAFKMGTWYNPAMIDKKEEYEPKLLESMGLERYVRNYYATII